MDKMTIELLRQDMINKFHAYNATQRLSPGYEAGIYNGTPIQIECFKAVAFNRDDLWLDYTYARERFLRATQGNEYQTLRVIPEH